MKAEELQPSTDPFTSEAIATRDLGLGNTYRIEYIKHLVSISTGVFVFSVTFMKDLVGPFSQVVGKPFLIAGWSVLVISIISGIFHMSLWASIYISWGLYWESPRAKRERAVLNRWRKIAERAQVLGFLAGLVLLVIFASLNLLH
jgi:amino acid transporter